MTNAPTPSVIRSIYRQVLRYAGSSVLYAHPARLNLRVLFRPEFDIWLNKAKLGEEQAVKDKPEWEEFSRRGVSLILAQSQCPALLAVLTFIHCAVCSR